MRRPGSIWVVSVQRNEADICEFWARHWFSQGIDGIAVMDNDSDDWTYQTLLGLETEARANGVRLVVQRDHERAHYQGRKLTALANAVVGVHGAEWICPSDADEFVIAASGRTVADALRACKHQVVGIELHNYWETGLDDPADTNPVTRMKWRDPHRGALDKAVYRHSPDLRIGEGSHAILGPNDLQIPGEAIGLILAHYPYRGAEHFVRKVEQGGKGLELARGLDPGVGVHWKSYYETLREHGAEALKAHYRRHFYHESPQDNLVYDPVPFCGGNK